MEIPDIACALQSACIPAATGIPCNHWIPGDPCIGTATAKPRPNLLRLPEDSFRDVMVPGRAQGAPRPSETLTGLTERVQTSKRNRDLPSHSQKRPGRPRLPDLDRVASRTRLIIRRRFAAIPAQLLVVTTFRRTNFFGVPGARAKSQLIGEISLPAFNFVSVPLARARLELKVASRPVVRLIRYCWLAAVPNRAE